MADVFSVQGSLPDQLPIIETISTQTSESNKALPPFIRLKKRKSTKLQNIMKPKRSVRPRYFSAGVKITDQNARDFTKGSSPFEYFIGLEAFAHSVMIKAWRNDVRIKELQKNLHERPSYKDRHKKDLLNRLYVKEPRIIGGKSVLTINPNYYSIVGGRPIADKLDIKEYIRTVRESLRAKIVIGYREDDIMKIEETMKLEQKVIDIIQENLQNYINVFEEFLIIDHRSAMKLLQESEEATKAAFDKYMEYKSFARKYAFLCSSLYNMEEKWKTCKTYQKFLYAVSPLTWQMQQDGSTGRRASIYMKERQPDDTLDIFMNYRSSLLQRGISLEDIIREFREEICREKPAQLYFTDPGQLLDVFRFIEMQNLNSLLHTEELAIPLAHIKDGMKTAELLFDKQIKKLEEIIEQLERGISWEEQRVTYLEEFAVKLIRTELKNVVRDENILNLYIFVEDIYEYIIGHNDANLTLWEMMSEIEEKYRRELILLDKVPSHQVAQLEGNYFKEEMMMMKLAETASKQYAELERITVSLNKAFTPPPEKQSKKPKNRSSLVEHSRKQEKYERSLTMKEIEYLEFFTDFCKYLNDPADYGITPSSVASANFKTKFLGNEATKEDIEELDQNLL